MRALFSIVLASALAASTASAKAPDTGASERATDAADKMICKRFTRTGSLASVDKVCRTKHEWELERANLRQIEQIDSCRARGTNGVGC